MTVVYYIHFFRLYLHVFIVCFFTPFVSSEMQIALYVKKTKKKHQNKMGVPLIKHTAVSIHVCL